jgi:putative flippase GtrA
MHLNRENPLSLLTSLKRSQIASGVSSLVDYSCLIFFTEVCHTWYILSAAIGGVMGGSLNFYLNRRWSFNSTSDLWHHQALRYLLVSITSLGLNLSGTYLLKESMKLHYLLASMVISFSVGILFNFPMQRLFIYRQSRNTPPSI